jgi:hypothetical protein
MIFFGGSSPRAARTSRCGLDGSVVCRKVPAGPVQVTACRRCSWVRIRCQVQGSPAAVSATRISSRGQPAQQDVGADPVLAPVVDRAQVQDLLHVTPAALDFQQLLDLPVLVLRDDAFRYTNGRLPGHRLGD